MTLRAGDSVEFYGHAMDTRYSGSAVYWLTSGAGRGTPIPAVSATPQPVGGGVFLAAAEVRERLTWFGAARNGDGEKFFGPPVYSQARTRTISADGLDLAGTGAAGGRAPGRHRGPPRGQRETQRAVSGDHLLRRRSARPRRARRSTGSALPGDNEVELVAPAAADLSLEQFVRLVYPRHTLRGSGALDFTLPGGGATRLVGFDPALTGVLDVTDLEAPVRLAIWEVSGDAAVATPGSGTRHLVAYTPADTAPPAAVLVNRPSSWYAAAGADLVMVGPSALFGALKPLVERRQSEGLRVALVDIEDIQDEFASGEKSVEALRRFLARGLEAWPVPPRFLLLVGAAASDPRDYLGLGGDLVPSAVVQTDSLEAVSDSWFLGVSGAESVSNRAAASAHRGRDRSCCCKDPESTRERPPLAGAAHLRFAGDERLPGDDGGPARFAARRCSHRAGPGNRAGRRAAPALRGRRTNRPGPGELHRARLRDLLERAPPHPSMTRRHWPAETRACGFT